MTEPATAQRQINIELSSQQETLKVGHASVFFQATVYNDSDRFASFQLKLLAAGATTPSNKRWYHLAPSVSSKIPPGDCTHFQIEVFDLPPITEQFRGAVDLTVEVTSRELDNQYDLEYLRLLVEGFQGSPPSLTFASPRHQAVPNERATIACQLHNPTATSLTITLRLFGLPDAWFPHGTQQILVLDPGKPQKITFSCEIPAPTQALSRTYPLRLEATGQFPSVTTTGEFYILPAGSLLFGCDPLECSIPELLGTEQNSAQDIATFTLQFNNQSNIELPVQIDIEDLQPKRRWGFWQEEPSDEEDPELDSLPIGVALKALPVALPIGASTALVEIQRQRPWLGWARILRFQVTAQTPEVPVSLHSDRQTVQVQLFPIIPLWQQVLGLLLAMGLGALTWFLLSDSGHRAPVNSLQFSGQGTEVLSGSDDQTVRRWDVLNSDLKPLGHLGNFDKAVRVIHYRPVNNDQVAVGFENGEIQVINLLTGQRSRLSSDKDDRVLALAFSRDARTLYSGHGSGLVLPWDITHLSNQLDPPQQVYDLGFAIQSMALVMDDDSVLAIAGRNNRLELLNLQHAEGDSPQTKPPNDQPTGKPFIDQPPSRKPTDLPQLIKLDYPSGGSTDYISSLSSAQQNPTLLAASDTQGRISLWDIPACIEKQGRCEAIDRPWLGHEGSPVRAVALSADGCFLASAGDDGRVKLWSLNEQGSRRTSALEGRVLAQVPQPLNAVDIIQRRDRIWVISGGDDGQVQLRSVSIQGGSRSFDVCPLLVGDR